MMVPFNLTTSRTRSAVDSFYDLKFLHFFFFLNFFQLSKTIDLLDSYLNSTQKIAPNDDIFSVLKNLMVEFCRFNCFQITNEIILVRQLLIIFNYLNYLSVGLYVNFPKNNNIKTQPTPF